MTAVQLILALIATSAVPGAEANNPLGKVLELLDSLKAKVVAEGEKEAKAYAEYIEWCDDATKNTQFELKSLKAHKEDLEATIANAAGNIEAGTSKIEELAKSIAASERDLSDATAIRNNEKADFQAAEHELVDSIDTLDRAIAIISREAAKNPALVQVVDTSSIKRLMQSIGAVIDAASFTATDRKQLLSLVQSRESNDAQDSDDLAADEAQLGAPAAATYKTHSTSIVDVLEDLKEKAEAQLADLRKAENNAQHNYNMLRQSLEDQKAADEKDMVEEKAEKSEATETKASAEGDLAVTVKGLANADENLATAQTTCMTVAADHEATMRARAEELTAIAKASEILGSSTGGAVEAAYSLFQVDTRSELHTRSDLANAEVVNLIKRLADQQHSAALAQLASKINAVLRFGSTSGEDPFVKVRALIEDLIGRLMAQANGEASEKAYCDEQMAKTEEKKSDLEGTAAKLAAKLDKAVSQSAALKEQVKQLQAELAALAKSQAEMDQIRLEENAAFNEAKAELTQGLEGVRKAIGVLKDYYGGAALVQDESQFGAFMQAPPKPEHHSAASGAGGSIIDILEVVESDFAKDLATREAAEADGESEYDRQSQENRVTKTMKDQDVKYKTKNHKSLDKSIAELTSDKETTGTELSAVLEYYDKIKARCIAKPETYEERKRRRETEIAGLKDALAILENETVFAQRGAHPKRRLLH